MRYRYPVSSQQLKDEFREIYGDIADIIGYVNATGALVYPGLYDQMDTDLDTIAETMFQISTEDTHFLASEKNTIMMREEPANPEIKS